MMALHEVCNVCDRKSHDKSGKFEDVITCSCCGEISHYSCLNLPKKVLQVITSYPWQCTACKTCEVCRSGKCEKKLLCCDGCDRSYHTFCLTPRLARLPRVREWLCSNCKLKYDSDTTTAAWSKTTSSPCSTQKPRRRLSLQTTSRKLGEPSVSSPGRFRRAVSLQDTLTKDRGSSAVSSSNTSDELPLHEKSKEKRKRRLESSSELSNDLCERKIIKLEDFDTVQEDKDHVKPERTPEKRKDVQTALGEVTPKSGGRVCKYRKSCPTPGCDGSGHSSGMLFSHHTKSGCPLLHGNSPAKQGQKKRHFEKKLPQSPESRRRSQRKLIPISNKSDLTHRLKVSIPSLPKSFAESYSKGRQTVKLSSEDNRVDTPESTKPISSSYQTKTVFTKEEEEKLKNLVTEYDFNMFMNAREKAAKMVGTVEPTSTSCNVRRIELGKYDIDAWYSSPYPQEYFHLPKVYVCEFCLKYMKSSTILRRHMAKCTWRYPPGDEIYRKGNISFFEVNGKTEKTYCQNLCLLAKLFLDHKTLYYDVEPFLFYVLTQRDNTGCHLIGYFSKEKKSRLNYNVSCILCLPPYMRRGFGKMLVAFSYLLSRKEGKTGSPERPLSDLGLISYRSYWKEILLGFLKDNREDCVCIKDISFLTGINTADIISTFQYLGMLKYWKGSHIILKCEDLLKEYEEKARSRPPDYATIDESCLKWIPPDKRSDES